MLKSQPNICNSRSKIADFLKKTSSQRFESITQNQIAPIGLMVLLGLTGISWLATSIVAPQSAQAYTARVNVALTRETDESFRSFLRRAEAVARAAAQRSFDRDILVTDVAVTVIGQNDGAIVPLMSLKVNRQAWRKSPDPQRWVTYFPNTDTLLGFEKTPEAPDAPQPGTTPSPAATPTPQAPTGPRVIELPGGNRRIIPASPPTNQTQPTPPTNQAPNPPGTPIPSAPVPSAPLPAPPIP